MKFALPQQDVDPALFVEPLLANGCDDALIGIGQHARLALDFIREAPSAAEAVVSALSDAQRSIAGVRLIEASPDLVGLTDIANILGFSRQNMRKLLVRSGPDFPLPVHDGKPAIWHLSAVLDWFANVKGRDLDSKLLDVSRVNMQCNLVRETAALDDGIADRLKELVA
ncbi:MAG: DNA-binding protein [Pseudomonadota bacterium]